MCPNSRLPRTRAGGADDLCAVPAQHRVLLAHIRCHRTCPLPPIMCTELVLLCDCCVGPARGASGTYACMQASARGLAADSQPWTMQTTPYSWLAASRGAHNALLPQSSCELEADCAAPDILNRRHAVRCRLADTAPDERLVESLALIWQEERDRRGGIAPPQPPPSPQRRPLDVCALVTAARIEFEALVQAVPPPNAREPCHAWEPADDGATELCARPAPVPPAHLWRALMPAPRARLCGCHSRTRCISTSCRAVGACVGAL